MSSPDRDSLHELEDDLGDEVVDWDQVASGDVYNDRDAEDYSSGMSQRSEEPADINGRGVAFSIALTANSERSPSIYSTKSFRSVLSIKSRVTFERLRRKKIIFGTLVALLLIVVIAVSVGVSILSRVKAAKLILEQKRQSFYSAVERLQAVEDLALKALPSPDDYGSLDLATFLITASKTKILESVVSTLRVLKSEKVEAQVEEYMMPKISMNTAVNAEPVRSVTSRVLYFVDVSSSIRSTREVWIDSSFPSVDKLPPGSSTAVKVLYMDFVQAAVFLAGSFAKEAIKFVELKYGAKNEKMSKIATARAADLALALFVDPLEPGFCLKSTKDVEGILCRRSTYLAPLLHYKSRFYPLQSLVLSDFHGLYSSQVTIFKDEKEEFLEVPYNVRVLSVPNILVSASGDEVFTGDEMQPKIQGWTSVPLIVYLSQMKARIRFLVNEAARRQVENLVIAIPNNPLYAEYLAPMFKSALMSSHVRGAFKTVIFVLYNCRDFKEFGVYHRSLHDLFGPVSMPLFTRHISKYAMDTVQKIRELQLPAVHLSDETGDQVLYAYLEAGELMAQFLLVVASLDPVKKKACRSGEEGLIGFLEFFRGSLDPFFDSNKQQSRSYDDHAAETQAGSVVSSFKEMVDFSLHVDHTSKMLQADAVTNDDFESQGFWQRLSTDNNRSSLVKKLARFLDILHRDCVACFEEFRDVLPLTSISSSHQKEV